MRHPLLECCSFTPLSSSHKDLLLSIWKMREMPRMLFGDLIEQNLVVRDVGFVLNGQNMSVALEGLEVPENLQLIRGLQRPCLLLISTHIILGLGTWRGTLNHMGR